MIQVDRTIAVSGSPDVLFALVSEPLRFPELFRAFSRVEQVSERGRAVGARYLMLMHIGHIAAGGVQRVTEFVPGSRVAVESEGAVALTGSITLSPLGPGRTEVRLVLDYEVPGFRLPARLVERLTRHVVDRHVQATLLSLRRLAEYDLPPLPTMTVEGHRDRDARTDGHEEGVPRSEEPP